MLDGLIETIHNRYADNFVTAGNTARGHWERLMARLEDINTSIQEGPTLEGARLVYNLTTAGGGQPITVRTLRTGESILMETISGSAAGGDVVLRLDGQLRYAKPFTGVATFDGMNCVIQGPGEVTVESAAPLSLYLQFKFADKDRPQPLKSAAGERGIGGVDPREAPGVAPQGRHAPMGETMIGVSSVN